MKNYSDSQQTTAVQHVKLQDSSPVTDNSAKMSDSRSTRKRKLGRPAVDGIEMMQIGAVIRKYREAARLEQGDIAKHLGYSKSAVGNWELGFTRPDICVIPKLCNYLNIPIQELMGMDAEVLLPIDDKRFLQVYHALDSLNQKTILQHMQQLCDDQEEREYEQQRRWNTHLLFSDALAPAAGVSVPLPDYADAETIYLRSCRAAETSDWLMKVNGDSMLPAYPNESLVFVNTKAETPVGGTGIFVVDGELFIKELWDDRLHSLNAAFPDIIFQDDMDIRPFGRVMGICDPNSILIGEALDLARRAFTASPKRR